MLALLLLLFLGRAVLPRAQARAQDSPTIARVDGALDGRSSTWPGAAPASPYAHAYVAKSDKDAAPAALQQQQSGDRPFRHPEHESVPCARCHDASTEHGRLLITRRAQCLSCHHAEGAQAQCSNCHDPAVVAQEVYAHSQTFSVANARPREATLDFVHAEHTEVACGTCHVEAVTLSASSVSCASCHTEHHQAESECVRCHAVQPPESAHPRTTHVTCGGAGCHETQPFEGGTRTRNLCLSCHQDYADHKPGGNCADCHALPPWHSLTVQRGGGTP